MAWMIERRYGLIVLFSLMATVWVFPYLSHAQEAATQPKLNSILDSLERTGEQKPALSRHYEVTIVAPEYLIFPKAHVGCHGPGQLYSSGHQNIQNHRCAG
jgi:hypothetical protein